MKPSMMTRTRSRAGITLFIANQPTSLKKDLEKQKIEEGFRSFIVWIVSDFSQMMMVFIECVIPILPSLFL